MGTPNTSPLLPISAGDGKAWKALRNISGADISCNVTVSHIYGTATYDMNVPANTMIQNDCIVNTVATGTLYGYPAI